MRHRKGIYRVFGSILLLVAGAFLYPYVEKFFDPETKVHYYIAKPVPKLDELKDVWCFPSAKLKRPDARRCSETEKTYQGQFKDPCFLADDNKTVECPQKPLAERKIYKYNKGSGYGAGPAPSWYEVLEETPWYIYLKDGIECGIDNNQDGYSLGKIDFKCSDGTKVILPVNTKEKLWELRCSNENDAHVNQCKILEIWL